jgi:hypothetical protein
MLTLKLENAVAFIDKLDTHVAQLGKEKIKSVLLDIIANHYKSYLNSYITNNQLGYYTLCTSLNAVEEGFVAEATKIFEPYGITVSDFVIKKIAIPKDIQHKLENQAFKIRQRRADVEADAELAKISLESYEAKLAVHSKYPDAEVTLTEYEKDLALKRYLVKVGKDTEESVDRSIKITQKAPKADAFIEKPEDIIPDIPTKPNTFRTAFCVLAAIAFIISMIILAAETGAGLIVLGIFVFIFGIIAAFNVDKFATVKIEPSIIGIPEKSGVSTETTTKDEV